MTDAQPFTQADLALIVWSVARRGGAVQDDIRADYEALADRYLRAGVRLTGTWLYAATDHLVTTGILEIDPIAGRSHRGSKARRWRLAIPTQLSGTPASALASVRAELPAVMSPRVLAEILEVSTKTLERWRNAGTGPDWIYLGGSRLARYTRDSVIAFIEGSRSPKGGAGR